MVLQQITEAAPVDTASIAEERSEAGYPYPHYGYAKLGTSQICDQHLIKSRVSQTTQQVVEILEQIIGLERLHRRE